MVLVPSKSDHAEYFRVRAVLFDTCGLTWFAKRPDGLSEIQQVMAHYCLLAPTTVLYELAFGSPEDSDPGEQALREMLFNIKRTVEMMEYCDAHRRKVLPSHGFLVVNPGFFEWWAARNRVLGYTALANARAGTQKRELSMDALIHACARNCFAPICTTNLHDFEKLNRASGTSKHDGTIPVFTPQQVLDSLQADIHPTLD